MNSARAGTSTMRPRAGEGGLCRIPTGPHPRATSSPGCQAEAHTLSGLALGAVVLANGEATASMPPRALPPQRQRLIRETTRGVLRAAPPTRSRLTCRSGKVFQVKPKAGRGEGDNRSTKKTGIRGHQDCPMAQPAASRGCRLARGKGASSSRAGGWIEGKIPSAAGKNQGACGFAGPGRRGRNRGSPAIALGEGFPARLFLLAVDL